MNIENPNLLALACAALVAAATTPASAQGGAGAFAAQMEKVLKPYLAIQSALAGDTTKGVEHQAHVLQKEAKKLDPKSVTGEHAGHYKDVPKKLQTAAAELRKAKSLKDARDAFKKLSRPMAMWASMAKPKGVFVVFCSMAKGSWLQRSKEIRNPYHGKEMLTCGEIVGGDTAK